MRQLWKLIGIIVFSIAIGMFLILLIANRLAGLNVAVLLMAAGYYMLFGDKCPGIARRPLYRRPLCRRHNSPGIFRLRRSLNGISLVFPFFSLPAEAGGGLIHPFPEKLRVVACASKAGGQSDFRDGQVRIA